MQRLAKQFGISDVALTKTCRRAEIPVPKRGYWAKSQAGKKVTRIALPPRGPGVSDEVFVGGRRYHWYEISDEELLEPIPLPATFPDDIEETRKLALKKIEKIKVQSPKGLRDRALLLLGFAGAFRRSELVALDLADLEFCSGGVRVIIRKSKTDQEGLGATIAITKGLIACPVEATRNWIEAAGITEGPVFRRFWQKR